jgi:hypothetical protein
LKGGRKERGKNGTLAATITTAASAPASSARAWPKDQCSSFASQRLSQITKGLSPACSCFMRGSR